MPEKGFFSYIALLPEYNTIIMLANEEKEQKVGAYWNYYDQARCIFSLCPWSLLEQELPTSAAAKR